MRLWLAVHRIHRVRIDSTVTSQCIAVPGSLPSHVISRVSVLLSLSMLSRPAIIEWSNYDTLQTHCTSCDHRTTDTVCCILHMPLVTREFLTRDVCQFTTFTFPARVTNTNINNMLLIFSYTALLLSATRQKALFRTANEVYRVIFPFEIFDPDATNPLIYFLEAVICFHHSFVATQPSQATS